MFGQKSTAGKIGQRDPSMMMYDMIYDLADNTLLDVHSISMRQGLFGDSIQACPADSQHPWAKVLKHVFIQVLMGQFTGNTWKHPYLEINTVVSCQDSQQPTQWFKKHLINTTSIKLVPSWTELSFQVRIPSRSEATGQWQLWFGGAMTGR